MDDDNIHDGWMNIVEWMNGWMMVIYTQPYHDDVNPQFLITLQGKKSLFYAAAFFFRFWVCL